ncbi:MAG TPA: prephenate dehydratase domain-containing protein, partial [Thermoanaerobaculia bacterium]
MTGDGSGRRPRVAFQGEAGAFSEQAALASQGGAARPVPCPTLEELFALTGAGGADFAVAPIENTLYGSVHRTYDLLAASPLHVVGEQIVHVRHHLIGCRGATLAGVRTVESHPVALGQCESFFAAHAVLRPREADDTAASVRRVCRAGDPERAAIGSERAARLYNGRVLARDIQDHPRNFTRFLVLARQRATFGERDKLAVTVQLAHRPGTLLRALEPFAARGIDLTRIESR